MKKKIFSVVTVLALLVAMLAVPVYAKTVNDGNGQLSISEVATESTETVTDGQLPIDPATGEFIWPEADGIDEWQFIEQPNATGITAATESAETVTDGQLPIDPATGEFIWPEADGIDEGQFKPQPRASSYNYSSSSFDVGVYLKGGSLFNIQNTPKFTSVKQSTISDGSCRVAYQIINNSTGQRTAVAKSGAWVNTSTTVSGFNSSIATGDCKVYLAGQDPAVEKKASGTFKY